MSDADASRTHVTSLDVVISISSNESIFIGTKLKAYELYRMLHLSSARHTIAGPGRLRFPRVTFQNTGALSISVSVVGNVTHQGTFSTP